MSWIRPRAFHRRALAAAALAAALVALPLAAYAGGGTDDGGPGSAIGSYTQYAPSTNASWACGQNIGKIWGVLYHDEGGQWVAHQAANYGGCLGDSQRTSGDAILCPTGYEVYRFYGYKGKAPIAVTRSRLNLTSWCASEQTYTFTAQTSWDANPAAAPGSPDYLPRADSVDQQRNLLPSLVGRRENGNLTSATPTQVFGSCATVSTRNPLIDWLSRASASENVDYRAALGDAYYKLAVRFAGGSVHTYPKTAASELGMSALSGYKYSVLPNQQTNPGRAPAPDPRGAHYYAKTITWENRPCETPFNFAQLINAVTNKVVGQTPIYGTCYIPLLRQARGMVDNNTGEKSWSFQELHRGYGERYSVYFSATRHDLGDPVPASWRTAMKNDYLRRSANAIDGFYGPQGQQIVPAQPYPSETSAKDIGISYGASPAQAADALASDAKCRFGNSVALDIPTSPPPPQAAKMQVKVSEPTVLQVGGSSYVAEFRVTGNQSQLICSDGKPCGNRALLTKLSYSMNLVGKNGYTKCATGQFSGCDYRIDSYSPGGPNRDGVLRVEFYNATSPKAAVELQVTNLSATYEYMVSSSGLTVTGYDPITGAPYKVSTGSTNSAVPTNFTPTATGSPLALRKAAANGYVLDLPVIGAVNVPIG